MSTRIADAQNFLDINGLNSIRQQAKATASEDKKAALQSAAKQFESIFMQMLMKSMRSAQDVLASDSPFNSESTKFYRDMHDQQLSVELSNNGSLGLADLIVRQLGGDDNFTPSSVLNHRGQIDQTFYPAKATDVNLVSNSNEKQVNREVSTNFVEINTDSPEDFIKSIAPYANKAAVALGVRPEVLVAQSALETGWGKKVITKPQGESSFNMFNIKADSRWQGEKVTVNTLEFENNIPTRQSANFRAYQSVVDSFNDFAQFLQGSPRYQKAIAQGQNSDGFVEQLQQAGYATDPQYADKIKKILAQSPIRKIFSAITGAGEE